MTVAEFEDLLPAFEKAYLKSSDGRIWFRKAIADSKEWGMAWLDPQTMVGCWFTTVVTNIVEDHQHNLWIVADGKLYKYQLDR